MQVKQVAQKYQIYVSAYVPERKRSVQVMAGSLDRYSLPTEVPDELAKGMHDALAKLLPDDQAKIKADDQAKELQDWLNAKHQAEEERRREKAGSMAAFYLAQAADEIEAGEPTEAEAARMFAALDRINKALRKAGHSRAKVQPKAAPDADPRQTSLI